MLQRYRTPTKTKQSGARLVVRPEYVARRFVARLYRCENVADIAPKISTPGMPPVKANRNFARVT